jgi:hypothetical protein
MQGKPYLLWDSWQKMLANSIETVTQPNITLIGLFCSVPCQNPNGKEMVSVIKAIKVKPYYSSCRCRTTSRASVTEGST